MPSAKGSGSFLRLGRKRSTGDGILRLRNNANGTGALSVILRELVVKQKATTSESKARTSRPCKADSEERARFFSAHQAHQWQLR